MNPYGGKWTLLAHLLVQFWYFMWDFPKANRFKSYMFSIDSKRDSAHMRPYGGKWTLLAHLLVHFWYFMGDFPKTNRFKSYMFSLDYKQNSAHMNPYGGKWTLLAHLLVHFWYFMWDFPKTKPWCCTWWMVCWSNGNENSKARWTFEAMCLY